LELLEYQDRLAHLDNRDNQDHLAFKDSQVLRDRLDQQDLLVLQVSPDQSEQQAKGEFKVFQVPLDLLVLRGQLEIQVQ